MKYLELGFTVVGDILKLAINGKITLMELIPIIEELLTGLGITLDTPLSSLKNQIK